MKHSYFLAALILLFTEVYAKNAEGYIVTLNNDTFRVQIKIPDGFSFGIGDYNLNKEIETRDSNGNTEFFTPAKIKAYGYTYQSRDYVYRVKPTKEGAYLFLRGIILGKKASLYKYDVSVSTRPNASSTEEFFTFEKTGNPSEKTDNTYLFLKNFDALETIREKLADFYNEDPAIRELIAEKFRERKQIQKDITDIMVALNKS